MRIGVRFRPLHDSFGVEVLDFDLSGMPTEADRAAPMPFIS
jgi:hypothetical protein